MGTASTPVFFDRGVPDMLGYAALFGFDYPPGRKAATMYRYSKRVFFAPAWEQIYTTDEERTISYSVAKAFGDDLREIYKQCGYELIDARAECILSML
jgi:predicted ATPase